MDERNYTVFHLHDDTSNPNGYMDSCTKFNDYINLAASQNMKAIAFSNHGGIYDWVKKKQYCDKKGIKYIHGIELYLCINLTDNHRGYHIGLYAKNWEGVKELNTLISLSTLKGEAEDNSDRHFYYNPRISFEELMATSDNIVITTACLASSLWGLSKDISEINPEKYEYNISKRDELLGWMSKNKHRCFLEIQYHKADSQIIFNKMLYEWSLEYDIPLIAGSDTHSSTAYKAECRKILQKSKDSFYGEEDLFDLTWKSYDEFVEMFKNQGALPEEVYMEAIENTNKFADMFEEYELDRSYKYSHLYGSNAKKEWKKLILKKLKDKLKNGAIDKNRIDEYKTRTYEEYNAMADSDMESFMMFMSELQTWCRENNIPSSPCRGSVGGSLVAYITDITDVDPLVWGTVFSRFHNPKRVSLPDIDSDYAPEDREKVYHYIINRLGVDNTAYILTMNTVQDRGSIDILAKGLDYKDLKQVEAIKDEFDSIFDKYKRIIQEEVNLEELEGAESKSPNFGDHALYMKVIRNKKARNDIENLRLQWENLRENNKDLFYYFDGLKGTIIAKGNHPAGIIGSPITLYDNLGVFYKDGDKNFPISFCSMKAVDSLNYVKYDILGLKTIGILKDIYEYLGESWKYAHEIHWDDENVWNDMIKSNVGVFQFEKENSHNMLRDFEPRRINDMSLVNAALRPSGKSYRDKLIKKEFNKNPSELIDKLLKYNYGYLVFQEDTIKFLTDVCGFDGADADIVRRAIGKKDFDLLNKMLPKVLEGYCENSPKPRDIAEEEAKKFIQIMEDSAEYQFGLNHSTGYSMNGYLMSYHRYCHPLIFATAYLNRAENDEDIAYGTKFVKEKNFNVQNPRFGYSKGKYFFDIKTNTIYKGLKSIKGISQRDGDALYELSKNKYNSFIELYSDIKKTTVDVGKMETLIKLDYFVDFGKSKKLLKIIEIYNNFYDRKQFSKDKLFENNLQEDIVRKYSKKETPKLFKELDTIGLVNEMISNIENTDISIKEKLSAEKEYFGYACTVLKKLKDTYFIEGVDEYKNKTSTTYYLNVFNVSNGDRERVKLKDYESFKFNPIKENDLIIVHNMNIENKKKKIEVLDSYGKTKISKKTGKPVTKWVDIPNEFWKIIERWSVI